MTIKPQYGKNIFFPDHRDYQIQQQGSLVAGCDGTLTAPLVLPRSISSYGTSHQTSGKKFSENYPKFSQLA